jgi:hypothetical protein
MMARPLAIAAANQTTQMSNLATAIQKTELATEKSAQASRDFADTAGKINTSISDAVGKLDAQAKATQAATRASIDALHISQRAYISVPSFVIDPANRMGTLRVDNTGHIPSGKVEVISREVTFYSLEGPTPDGQPPPVNAQIQEAHWSRNSDEAVTSDTRAWGGCDGGHRRVRARGYRTCRDRPILQELICKRKAANPWIHIPARPQLRVGKPIVSKSDHRRRSQF